MKTYYKLSLSNKNGLQKILFSLSEEKIKKAMNDVRYLFFFEFSNITENEFLEYKNINSELIKII